MSDINVTSHNQSGGITAGTINGNGSARASPPGKSHKPKKSHEPKWWKRIWVWLCAFVGFLAAVVAVLEYFGIGPWERDMTEKSKPTTINVTSHGQSGGVTAGVVNVGPQSRHLSAADTAQIVKAIPRGADVTITATMTSDEALAFAFEIYNWMKANGYPEVKGPNSAMWTQPIFGQQIRQNGQKYDILIGTAQ